MSQLEGEVVLVVERALLADACVVDVAVLEDVGERVALRRGLRVWRVEELLDPEEDLRVSPRRVPS